MEQLLKMIAVIVVVIVRLLQREVVIVLSGILCQT